MTKREELRMRSQLPPEYQQAFGMLGGMVEEVVAKRKRIRRLRLVLLGIVVFVTAVILIARWESGGATAPVKLEAKQEGIQLRLFYDGKYWSAVKWPSSIPEPIMGQYIGKSMATFAFPKLSERYEMNEKLKPFCFDNRATLDCGELWKFLTDPTTWDKVVVGEKEWITSSWVIR